MSLWQHVSQSALTQDLIVVPEHKLRLQKKKKKLEALKAQKGKTVAQVKKEKQQAEEQEKWRW